MNGFGTARTRPLQTGLALSGWVDGNAGENRVVAILNAEGVGPGFNGVSGVLDCHQQYPVGKYPLDFAWPKLRIALEADGSIHSQPGRYAKDRERDAWLREQGWLVFRVDTTKPGQLVRQVHRVLAVVHAMARS